VYVEELLQQADGYGIAKIIVAKRSKVAGSNLNNSGFTERDLIVLSIERDKEVIHVPDAETRILTGDRLICYGKLDNLKGLI